MRTAGLQFSVWTQAEAGAGYHVFNNKSDNDQNHQAELYARRSCAQC